MKLAVLGTGSVGHIIATKLVDLGHDVTMGSRTSNNAKANAWANEHGDRAHAAMFRDAVEGAEMVFNCTAGAASIDVVHTIGPEKLAGKILVDISNPLDFSNGFPPSLTHCNTTSLAEAIQALLPDTKVVKALNTVAGSLMVDPGRVEGSHATFVCGNDDDAKAKVSTLLREGFGWSEVIDLGGLENARGTEAYLLLWTRVYRALGTGEFNIEIRRARA